MSTPFFEISELMVEEMNKHELFNGAFDSDVSLKEISNMILKGALVDFRVCRKDLSKNKPYDDISIARVLNSDAISITIDITGVEESYRDSFALFINNEEVQDYSYNIAQDEIEITYNFNQGDKIELKFMFEGEFEEDLSFREKYIIALAGCSHMLSALIQRETSFIKKLGDKDYSVEKRTDLSNIRNDVYSTLRIYLKEYDYDNLNVEDLT